MKSRPIQIYLGLVAFSLIGSLFSKGSHLDPTPIARPVALLTLVAGCYAAFESTVKSQGSRAVVGLASVWIVGVVAETVGLGTGYPFGRYHYTERWWPVLNLPAVGHFPLQLPFAWMLVVGCAYLACAQKIGGSAVLLTAVIATLVDQAMEPTMTHTLKYWAWSEKGPLAGHTPVINAIGWFCVSLVAACLLRWAIKNEKSPGSSPGIVLGAYLLLVLGLGVMKA